MEHAGVASRPAAKKVWWKTPWAIGGMVAALVVIIAVIVIATKGSGKEDCTCENGVAINATQCVRNDTHRCLSCNAGFVQTKWTCKDTKDGCNGKHVPEGAKQRKSSTELKGDVCVKEEKPAVSAKPKCDAGKHMDDKTKKCVADVCKCTDGTLDTTKCAEHDAENCKECNTGFKLNDKKCTKTCKCENGKPHTGNDCPKDGDKTCASCDAGFKLDNKKCVKKTDS